MVEMGAKKTKLCS